MFPIHPLSTPWKHRKTLRFSDVFREQRKGALGTYGLTICKFSEVCSFENWQNRIEKLKWRREWAIQKMKTLNPLKELLCSYYKYFFKKKLIYGWIIIFSYYVMSEKCFGCLLADKSVKMLLLCIFFPS